jgi:hypothetical protein
LERLNEVGHEPVAFTGKRPTCLGLHAFLEKKQLLVEMVDGSTAVMLILGGRRVHDFQYRRIMNGPLHKPAVGECAGYPDSPHGIQSIGILYATTFDRLRQLVDFRTSKGHPPNYLSDLTYDPVVDVLRAQPFGRGARPRRTIAGELVVVDVV